MTRGKEDHSKMILDGKAEAGAGCGVTKGDCRGGWGGGGVTARLLVRTKVNAE